MSIAKNVIVKEVGPRDGLQNEATIISTDDKVTWINQLAQTGLSYIEITSFVHPNWIPALADAVDVAKKIKRKKGVTYAALVPNRKGLERALEANIDEVSVFMSASDTHNQKNINRSMNDTFSILREVVDDAMKEKKTTRAYISTVFGCPYEKKVPIDNVLRVTDTVFQMGVNELSLGDTIGVANPVQVEQILDVLLKRFPSEKLAMHFHDTRGLALVNVFTALKMGIKTFDSSVGGLGGCPYAPGASGNVPTEDLVYLLEQMGVNTGIQLNKLLTAASWIEKKLKKTLPSHNLQLTKGSNFSRFGS